MTTPASKKKPWYPWFPRDFSSDERVILMDLDTECCYRRLLDHQWLHQSVPAELSALAKICKGISKTRMRRIWATLAPLFPSSTDDTNRLQNRRLERVRSTQDEIATRRRQKAKTAADTRWEEHRKQQSSRSAPSTPAGNAPSIAQAMHGDAIPEPEPETEPKTAARAAVPPPASADPVHNPVMRCTIAANRGLRANPKVGTQFNELATSNQTGVVGEWLLAGVPAELAERVVFEKATAYVPKGRNRQPMSLAYFTSAVLEAHERERDQKAQAAASQAMAEGAAHKRAEVSRRPVVHQDGLPPDQVPDVARLMSEVGFEFKAPADSSGPEAEAERREGFKRAAEAARQERSAQ